MVSLRYQKDYKQVRRLSFCYLCGCDFVESDDVDRDHVPPAAAFDKRDREPLILKTHRACNSALSIEDRKIGQLIALRRHEQPSSPRDQALKIVHYANLGMTAVENLDIDGAVWRWVRGFHAALYRQPLTTKEYHIQTPFPRGDVRHGRVSIMPIRPQHLVAVEAIKRNRAARTLDIVVTNNGKLRYECVWCETDSVKEWLCIFALDIYDWKDLGSHSSSIPARGCVGQYMLPDHSLPDGAACDSGVIVMPNKDPLDAFGP